MNKFFYCCKMPDAVAKDEVLAKFLNDVNRCLPGHEEKFAIDFIAKSKKLFIERSKTFAWDKKWLDEFMTKRNIIRLISLARLFDEKNVQHQFAENEVGLYALLSFDPDARFFDNCTEAFNDNEKRRALAKACLDEVTFPLLGTKGEIEKKRFYNQTIFVFICQNVRNLLIPSLFWHAVGDLDHLFNANNNARFFFTPKLSKEWSECIEYVKKACVYRVVNGNGGPAVENPQSYYSVVFRYQRNKVHKLLPFLNQDTNTQKLYKSLLSQHAQAYMRQLRLNQLQMHYLPPQKNPVQEQQERVNQLIADNIAQQLTQEFKL